jgi:hypothetical protein
MGLVAMASKLAPEERDRTAGSPSTADKPAQPDTDLGSFHAGELRDLALLALELVGVPQKLAEIKHEATTQRQNLQRRLGDLIGRLFPWLIIGGSYGLMAWSVYAKQQRQRRASPEPELPSKTSR